MLSKIVRFIFIAIASCTLIFSLFAAPSYSHPHLSADSKVGLNSIGAVKIGMTIKEAETASRTKLISEPITHHIARIYYRRWHPDKRVLSGVDFIVFCDDEVCSHENISRIEISNPKIATISKIKIGDAIAKVKSTYPNRIEDIYGMVNYTKLEALLFKPSNRAEQNYLWFDLADGKVKNYRMGTSDSIYAIDNCLKITNLIDSFLSNFAIAFKSL